MIRPPTSYSEAVRHARMGSDLASPSTCGKAHKQQSDRVCGDRSEPFVPETPGELRLCCLLCGNTDLIAKAEGHESTLSLPRSLRSVTIKFDSERAQKSVDEVPDGLPCSPRA